MELYPSLLLVYSLWQVPKEKRQIARARVCRRKKEEIQQSELDLLILAPFACFFFLRLAFEPRVGNDPTACGLRYRRSAN